MHSREFAMIGHTMPFTYDDGGRADAGYKGHTGDCVARSIAIATQRPYRDIYDALAHGNATQRQTRRTRTPRGRTARHGIHVKRKWFRDFMASLGWEWVPTMHIGSGCTVHLTAGELPMGRLIVAVSKHYTAVIDGIIHDTHDPQRRIYWYDDHKNVTRVTERCVYGYWRERTA